MRLTARGARDRATPFNESPRIVRIKKDQTPDEIVLSDAQVRDVIERATRVVPERTGITVADLRQIAAELDIDPSAFEAALDQTIGLPVPGSPIRSWIKRQAATVGRFVDSFLPQSGRLIGSAMFGGVAGWLNAFLMIFSLNGHYPIAAGMIGLTIANLLSRRLDRNFSRYLAETFAQWVSYTVAWSVTYGEVTQNLVIWFALWTSLATVLGFLFVRDSSHSGGNPAPLNDATQRIPRQASDDSSGMHRVRLSPQWLLPALVGRARA